MMVVHSRPRTWSQSFWISAVVNLVFGTSQRIHSFSSHQVLLSDLEVVSCLLSVVVCVVVVDDVVVLVVVVVSCVVVAGVSVVFCGVACVVTCFFVVITCVVLLPVLACVVLLPVVAVVVALPVLACVVALRVVACVVLLPVVAFVVALPVVAFVAELVPGDVVFAVVLCDPSRAFNRGVTVSVGGEVFTVCVALGRIVFVPNWSTALPSGMTGGVIRIGRPLSNALSPCCV